MALVTYRYSFVTGLVDSKIHGQRKTMFQRAVDLGLPASFVELRHEATHRELPSLVVLRGAAQRSLLWLWGYYWANIDDESIISFGADHNTDHDAIKKAVRGTLEAYEENNKEPARKKRRLQQQYRQSFTASRLASICKDFNEGPVMLSRSLLEDSILIPAGRK